MVIYKKKIEIVFTVFCFIFILLDAPIFIYIHGGYWQELEKETSGYVVEPFYKNKIKSFVVGYTLCPEGTIGEIIKEIQSAVKKIIQYATEKSSRYGLLK